MCWVCRSCLLLLFVVLFVVVCVSLLIWFRVRSVFLFCPVDCFAFVRCLCLLLSLACSGLRLYRVDCFAFVS